MEFLNGKVLTAYQVSFNNDVGGTSMAVGCFKFRVTKSWNDYETGGRLIGELIDKVKIEELKKIGTTGNKDTNKNYEPKVVYVSEFDILKKNVAKAKARKVQTLDWFNLPHEQKFGSQKEFLLNLLKPIMA